MRVNDQAAMETLTRQALRCVWELDFVGCELQKKEKKTVTKCLKSSLADK